MKARGFLYIFVVLVLAGIVARPAFSQNQFVKTLGGDTTDYGISVVEVSDTGFVVTGYTNSYGAGAYDILLVKFDGSGNHLWTRTLGGDTTDYGISVVEVSDTGFVVTGYTYSYGAGYSDLLLTKFDSSGNHLWTRTLGGDTTDYGISVVEVSYGGFVVTGYTNSYGAGAYDILLTRFDGSGNHLWTRTVGGTGYDAGYSVVEVSDGGLVVTGYTNSYGAGAYDILLTKFDGWGNHRWTRTLGGTGYDAGYSVVEVSDGGIVVAGYTTSYGAGSYDLLLAKFDGSGNHLWTRTLGGTSDDYGRSVVEVSDGGLVITGYTESYGAGSYDLLLAKFDGSGNHLWTRTLGGASADYGYSMIEVSDGGLVITGCTSSYGAGGSDLLLAKFDGSGNTCLGEFVTPEVQSVSPDTASPTPTVTTALPTITSPDPTVTSPDPTETWVCEIQPRISSITDVGNDQGKQVTISWNRSWYDAPGDTVTITSYSLWRRIDELPSTLLQAPEADVPPRLSYPPGDWHYVLTVPARGEEVYHCVAPTLCDSTADDGICWSVFFVSAMTPDPLVYFDSPPDSGYSVDNLAPAVPKGLMATLYADSTVLTWRPNTEEDLAYYAIYRDSCPDFMPGTPLDYTIDTTHTDLATGYCYKVSAFDFAGNESPLTGPVSVGDEGALPELPKDFSLSQNYPNPFNPVTEIRYALSRSCKVKLEVYNLLGQKMATLIEKRQKAGYKTARWDAGSFASGIYFYRLQAGDFVQTRKMVLIR